MVWLAQWRTGRVLRMRRSHAAALCMDNRLDLGNEARVRRYATLLRRLTAPDAFEDSRFIATIVTSASA